MSLSACSSISFVSCDAKVFANVCNALVPSSHEVIIDMGMNVAIYSVELPSRVNNKSPSVIDVSFSSDQVNWREPFRVNLFTSNADPSTQRKFPSFAHSWIQGHLKKKYT